MLRYTVQGQSHTLLENITALQAREILDVIRRRGGFLPEQGGIFRPENIDAIHHTPRETTVSWYRVTGGLNADAATRAQLKKRTDFLHVDNIKTGHTDSYNVSSICLVQPMDDGTSLLVDKYGTPHILEGKITLPTEGNLMDMGGALFNPENASIIRFHPNDPSFEFRIEGTDFEKLLSPHGADFFYAVEADADSLTRLESALAGNPNIHAPNKTDLSNLFFNMKALGYLALDTQNHGFYCKRHSMSGKPGFIQVEAVMANEIISGLGKKAGILHIGNVLMHEDSIDNIYYHHKRGKIQFVMGREIQEISDASLSVMVPDILERLSQGKSFITVAQEDIVSGSRVHKHLPTDIIRMDRATLFSYSAAQGRTQVIVESSAFPINLDKWEARGFFARIAKEGLASLRRQASLLPWTESLPDTLSALPVLKVRVPPSETENTPAALLRRVLDQADKTDKTRDKTDKEKKLSNVFSTVASLPPAHSQFHYPEWKKDDTTAAPTASAENMERLENGKKPDKNPKR
jgi:hypothetical protein